MKTKLFFFILLLVGVGNGFAQSANPDSILLLQEIKQARNLLENWDATPGTENDKLLAFMTGDPVQVTDSIKKKGERCLGFLIVKTYHYKRYIRYDKINKVFKDKLELSEKTNDIDRIILLAVIYSFLVFGLAYFTGLLYMDKINIAWGPWAVVIPFLLFFSHYLGSLLTIASLIYIFKDGIRETIEKFLQKRGKKENKEQD